MIDLISSIFSFSIGVFIAYILVVTLKFIYVKVINRKKLTPFERAGYTKETKFKVLVNNCGLRVGDIVTLNKDDGSVCPLFQTKDGRWCYTFLPNTAPRSCDEELEVYEEDN